ncbi:hypothetical protein Q9L58_010012 [Maublancomyces gigas]|uniref:Uncharacterized protein n=1 Tax=Discina gigas TaxID=1032678 RepID=A0ABR3G5J2_9PEZI
MGHEHEEEHEHVDEDEGEADDPPEYDSNDELAERLDAASDLPEKINVGSISTLERFAPEAGSSVRAVAAFQEEQDRLVAESIIPFLTAYDFHLPKLFIETKTTKTKMEKYVKKGLYGGDSSYKSASSLFKVIKDIPTTLGARTWTF